GPTRIVAAIYCADASADHDVGRDAVLGQRMHHANLNGAEAATAGEDERRFGGSGLLGYEQGWRCSLNRRVGYGPRDGRRVIAVGKRGRPPPRPSSRGARSASPA